MGFIQRAFTPPGTGGLEAAAQQQAAAAQQAAMAAKPKEVEKTPDAPTAPAPAAAPKQFAAGSAPGAKQKAAITASTMLGAAAASGQTAKKTALGA
jgi:hypothetical protein